MNTDPVGRLQRSRWVTLGLAAMVMAGWYTALLTTLTILWTTLPSTKSCDAIGFSCSPNPQGEILLLAIVFGIPALLGSLAVSAGVLGVLVAVRVPSGIVAGTVAAWAGWCVVALVLLIMIAGVSVG